MQSANIKWVPTQRQLRIDVDDRVGTSKKLIGKESIWYKEKSTRRNMFENGREKLIWDFAYLRRNKITKRRPYLTLKQKEKFILLCDIACTQEHKIKKKEKK